MNTLLGSGDESKGRPLLGGIGQSAESSSARQGSGFGFSGALEAFARVASSIASGGGFGTGFEISPQNPNDPDRQER